MEGPLFFDRVKETTTTIGTSPKSLVGASIGYRTFASVLGDGDLTAYAEQGQSGGEWEVGIGTFAAGSNTITPVTILGSSNGGSAVAFSVGTKDIFLTAPAIALQPQILAKTAAYAILPADCLGPLLLTVDASLGAVTITLPSAARKTQITVKKIDSSGNAVLVAALGGDVIDDASSVDILSPYSPYTFVSNGDTKWWMT